MKDAVRKAKQNRLRTALDALTTRAPTAPNDSATAPPARSSSEGRGARIARLSLLNHQALAVDEKRLRSRCEHLRHRVRVMKVDEGKPPVQLDADVLDGAKLQEQLL